MIETNIVEVLQLALLCITLGLVIGTLIKKK
jgi:hypothetical protein